jgi:hypothetical protein
MVMFEVYVLKGGVDSEVDVGFIESNCILKGPHCFCKPKPRETVEFLARSQVSTHFWCIHSYSHSFLDHLTLPQAPLRQESVDPSW